jgi:alpha-ketoglutarate-dependent taurine dioxygenase
MTSVTENTPTGTLGSAVTPLTPAFGAEVCNADLRDPMWKTSLPALLDLHRVLVFRKQFLSHADQVMVGNYLGELTPAHPVVPGHPDHPEILELDGSKGGKNAQWHTDVTFVVRPHAASVLVADELPTVGGDTLWADLEAAYTKLSEPLRELVDKLEAVHRIAPLAYWGEPFDTALSRDDATKLLEDSRSVPPVIHPVVRVHPRTGKPALFVNQGFTSHIVGFARHESDALLRLLFDHTTQPEFFFRHHWQPGDVVMWDNQATMHYAVDDYGTAARRVRRVTVRGDEPVGKTGVQSRVATDPRDAIR